MPLQQPGLLVGQHEGRVLARLALQAHEPLVAGFQIVAQPHPAHARRGDFNPAQTQLVGYALGAVRWPRQAVVEDLGLDLGAHAVGVRAARPAPALHEPSHPAGLEGAAYLVEGIAVIAHDLAGAGNIAQFVSQLQQRQFPFDTVR